MDGGRWQHERPTHGGLFWPGGRHLFRRRRPLALRLAQAALVAGSAALLGLALAGVS